MKEKEKKVFMVLKQSFAASIVEDVVTFGIPTALFAVNHIYIGSTALAVFLFILFSLWIIGKASNASKRFYCPEDAIAYIKEQSNDQ